MSTEEGEYSGHPRKSFDWLIYGSGMLKDAVKSPVVEVGGADGGEKVARHEYWKSGGQNFDFKLLLSCNSYLFFTCKI
ncbi:hypothetical protein GWI33_018630 [Rhynchophorus ferrugineus]|uniref:Uncharacterized protein n=1 Tax=Rhynchophorus ferrugineus TaxID=354439 RepID=A0A834I6V9_RHYFE|nr:hypothetical protein GWI33_018630 [Rhynchophorus ferrugineus]